MNMTVWGIAADLHITCQTVLQAAREYYGVEYDFDGGFSSDFYEWLRDQMEGENNV